MTYITLPAEITIPHRQFILALPDSQADLRFWVTVSMQTRYTDQTQPTKHKLRGAQLWGGQSPAETFKNDFGWTCLECDDFLQLCQVDSDFPHFISVIIRTKYRIECLLSNVSNAIRRSCVLILQCFTKFQMFRSAYRTGRMHDRQFGHRKNKTKWGHQQFLHLINHSFILAFRCSAWRNVIIGDLTLGISYLISWRMQT